MKKIKAITPTDQTLLEGLALSKRQSIKAIYDLALPSVIHWVKDNSGTEDDARDIYQEALIALYDKINQKDFTLTCSLKSFIRIMCRNIWLSKIRNKSKLYTKDIEDADGIEIEEDLLQALEHSEQEKLYFKHFNLLGESCQTILRAYFEKTPVKEIAKNLDTSESYVKKRKFQCKEKLINAIQADPIFKHL